MTTTTVLLLSDGYFQQDYVQCHKVHVISNCFLEQENNPQSPDFNPVDHFWDAVEKEQHLQQLHDDIVSILKCFNGMHLDF